MQGGADQGLPVIVSKVASGTPADLCIPRLNEGDQVLFINGRDISSLTHEQVNSAYSLANSCTPVVFCISSVTFFFFLAGCDTFEGVVAVGRNNVGSRKFRVIFFQTGSFNCPSRHQTLIRFLHSTWQLNGVK